LARAAPGVARGLNTVQETTAKVQGERQIRMLHDLAARATEAKSEEEAYRICAEVLATNELDVPFSLLYVLGEKGTKHGSSARAAGATSSRALAPTKRKRSGPRC
jgi:hypothetical protein